MKQPQQQVKAIVPSAKKVGIASEESISGPVEDVASNKVETLNTTKKGDITMEATKSYANFGTENMNENVLKMMKFSLDATFESIAKVQEYNDKLIKDMIKTNKQLTAETEKIVGEVIEEGKKGWDEYRKVVEEGYKKFEGIMPSHK